MSSSSKPPGMKLKINTGASGAPAPPTPDPNPTPSLKLKLKGPTAKTPSAEAAGTAESSAAPEPEKKKRKYTKKNPAATPSSKKRGRNGDDDSPPAKRVSTKGARRKVSVADANGTAAPPLLASRPSLPRITIKAKQEPTTPAITPRVRVKHSGQPPPRPLGAGYDSEASDAEVDPTIESQFILRMTPGEDCDYLRKAIEEKKLGLKQSEGGADVSLRFLDREGRRSLVTIKGQHYAASMVDLPCVIESMKSWDKRGWWKSADICQMLLVLGPVPNEEAAKAMPLPKEVDQATSQYAHGLTPPMHWVRKRRFRKRISYRTIEAVEDEVERLLTRDASAAASGGRSEYQWLDLNASRDSSDAPQSEDEAEENYYEGEQDQPEANDYFGEAEELDIADLEAEMEDALGDDDDHPADPDQPIPSTDMMATPSSAEPGGQAATQEASEADDTGDDDDESEPNDAPEEVDEEALAQQQEAAQQREEIADLEREVQNATAQMNAQTNPLLRQRLKLKVDTLQNDLDLKRGMAGEESDS